MDNKPTNDTKTKLQWDNHTLYYCTRITFLEPKQHNNQPTELQQDSEVFGGSLLWWHHLPVIMVKLL
jgi:hypothetical protein